MHSVYNREEERKVIVEEELKVVMVLITDL